MKINEARKKVEKLKKLMSEYGTTDTLIKAMEKMGNEAEGTFLQNLKRRRINIEIEFDTLLK
jgi:N-methylhydantoinase B/oxoprolinase/acetone carboxylase alpha subunit